MHVPARLVIKRLIIIPISLFVLVTVSFGLIELMPGDPALAIAGEFGGEERAALIRRQLGLDLPLPVRYVNYWRDLAAGDLGSSLYTREPILTEIRRVLPTTVEMVVFALAFAVVMGLSSGIAAAYFYQRFPDRLTRVVITLFQSIPDFLLSLLLIFLVFFLWRLAPPPLGNLPTGVSRPQTITGFQIIDALLAGQWGLALTALHYLMLPALALGLYYYATFAKMARATMAESLSSAQVQFARACGLPEWKVLRYAFTTARTPIYTYGAILLADVIAGAAIVEVVFSREGFGQWGLNAILKLDIPAIQGFILVFGVVTLFVYFALDLLVLFLDPRVSYGS
jgi:ABC-type dipeptide/oligopeptide/nickel transport system permease component